MYTHPHTRAHTHARTHARTHTHTYTHTHTHTKHTHTSTIYFIYERELTALRPLIRQIWFVRWNQLPTSNRMAELKHTLLPRSLLRSEVSFISADCMDILLVKQQDHSNNSVCCSRCSQSAFSKCNLPNNVNSMFTVHIVGKIAFRTMNNVNSWTVRPI